MRVSQRFEHVTGVIRRGPRGPVIACDGGGEWELGYSRRVMQHLDQRVEVQGSRCGFNELDCKRIWRAGELQPSAPSLKLEDWLAGGLIAYGLYAALSWLLA